MSKIIGITNGCFDLLHEGHVHLLREAKKRCHYLVVAINSDESVRALKGADRPRQTWKVREQNVRKHLHDHDVTWLINSEDILLECMRVEGVDVIFKGKEYDGKSVVGDNLARVCLIPMLPGHSTTNEIKKRGLA